MGYLENLANLIKKIYKNTGLFVSLIVAFGSFIFPIYAFLTEQSMIIPSVLCGILFILALILSLISYYEERIKEIKNSHEFKLNEKLVDGTYTPSQYEQRYSIFVEKGVIKPKK